MFLWSGLLLIATLQTSFGHDHLTFILAESVLVFVGGSITLTRLLRTGFWSPGNLLYVVVGLFHLGLVPFWIFHMDPEFARPDDYAWFNGDVGAQSLVLVLAAMVAYVLGVSLTVAFGPVDASSGSPREPAFVPDRRATHYAVAGAVLTLLGLLAWFVIGISAGGLTVFVGSYASWLALTGGSAAISLAYAMIGVGVALTLMAPATRLLTVALVAFGAFAGVAFFLGLRGEVLFPVAVAASVLAFRRSMPRVFVTLASAAAVLVLISAAKVIRQLGVSGTAFNWAEANPLSALAEMGSTLRVVATTIIWHGGNGEPFRGGDTYTVSIVRAFEAVFDPLGRPPGGADFRLMNTEIMARSGGIGGSIVGEAFHNFAYPGVIAVFLILGVIFGYFSSMTLTSTRIAIYVCAAVPLFNHVRNSFVPVIPMFVLGLIVLLSVRVFGDIFDGRSRQG